MMSSYNVSKARVVSPARLSLAKAIECPSQLVTSRRRPFRRFRREVWYDALRPVAAARECLVQLDAPAAGWTARRRARAVLGALCTKTVRDRAELGIRQRARRIGRAGAGRLIVLGVEVGVAVENALECRCVRSLPSEVGWGL